MPHERYWCLIISINRFLLSWNTVLRMPNSVTYRRYYECYKQFSASSELWQMMCDMSVTMPSSHAHVDAENVSITEQSRRIRWGKTYMHWSNLHTFVTFVLHLRLGYLNVTRRLRVRSMHEVQKSFSEDLTWVADNFTDARSHVKSPS